MSTYKIVRHASSPVFSEEQQTHSLLENLKQLLVFAKLAKLLARVLNRLRWLVVLHVLNELLQSQSELQLTLLRENENDDYDDG